MKKRIGLMGGTFDPIHLAHLHIAEESRQAFSLAEVLFIPAAQPPHKQGRKIASAKKRVKIPLKMLKKSVKNKVRFSKIPLKLKENDGLKNSSSNSTV